MNKNDCVLEIRRRFLSLLREIILESRVSLLEGSRVLFAIIYKKRRGVTRHFRVFKIDDKILRVGFDEFIAT